MSREQAETFIMFIFGFMAFAVGSKRSLTRPAWDARRHFSQRVTPLPEMIVIDSPLNSTNLRVLLLKTKKKWDNTDPPWDNVALEMGKQWSCVV